MSKLSPKKWYAALGACLASVAEMGYANAENTAALVKDQGASATAETIVLSILLVILLALTWICGRRFMQARKKYDEALESNEDETR